MKRKEANSGFLEIGWNPFATASFLNYHSLHAYLHIPVVTAPLTN